MTPTPTHGAVRALYEAERGPLWRALLAWSGSRDVADEAVAEAFAQLLRRGGAVRDPKAWVWRAAFKVAAGDLQRRRARATVPLEGIEPTPPEPLSVEAVDLVRSLRCLSEQQRACVALVLVADRPATEAARILGTSPATVRVQIMRARARLRHELRDQEESHG